MPPPRAVAAAKCEERGDSRPHHSHLYWGWLSVPDEWSLDESYDAYPRIEENFQAALDTSLNPRGPDMLYDLVSDLGLSPGATVVDVGCGEGRHSVKLAERFGFAVTGSTPSNGILRFLIRSSRQRSHTTPT
jgi:2-polyprenyl-3-methyl-5-hydroxy-6-metoxy-1,4-benzoquinol methylase